MELAHRIERGAAAERLLLLVHGLGADENDLAGLLPHLDPAGRFLTVLPRGPLPVPPGYGWFPFGRRSEGDTTFVDALDALDELVDRVCAEQGLARDQAVFGGFSQGCAMAVALTFRRDGGARPAGVLAMSGFLATPSGVHYDWAPPHPAVLQQHGAHDPLIAVHRARNLAATLALNGVPVVWREYPMQHEVRLESVTDARDWLELVVAGERPDEPDTGPPPAPVG